MSFIVFRYIFMGIVAIEVFSMPILLSNELYTSYDFTKQLILFSPMLVVGYISGILVAKFKDNIEIEPRDHIPVFLLFSALYAWALGDLLLIFSASAFIFLTSFEKIFIGEGHYLMASVQKATISIIAIAVAAGLTFFDVSLSNPDSSLIAHISFVAGTCVWFICFSRWVPGKWKFPKIPDVADLLKIKSIMILGLSLSIQTASLGGALLAIRGVALQIDQDFAFELFLSLNFYQLVLVGVNAIAFSNQRELGLSQDKTQIINRMKTVFKITILAFAITAIPYYLYGDLLLNRQLDLYLYLGIGFPMVCFFAVSAFFIVFYYNGQGLQITLLHLALLCCILMTLASTWWQELSTTNLTWIIACTFAVATLAGLSMFYRLKIKTKN